MASSLPYNHNLITGVDSIAVTNVPDSRGGANRGHVLQRVQTLQATLEFCLPNMGNNPFTQVSPYVWFTKIQLDIQPIYLASLFIDTGQSQDFCH